MGIHLHIRPWGMVSPQGLNKTLEAYIVWEKPWGEKPLVEIHSVTKQINEKFHKKISGNRRSGPPSLMKFVPKRGCKPFTNTL
jgi:hypothetical protein